MNCGTKEIAVKKHEVVELLNQFREDEDVDTEKLIQVVGQLIWDSQGDSVLL
jgi:hypothetical protein